MTDLELPRAIAFRYRNWRGEVANRTAFPKSIWWGSTEWHPEPGWLMTAWDVDKEADRDFALADCQFSPAALRPEAQDGVASEPCGGCGESDPQKRCMGCLHDFGDQSSKWVARLSRAED